MNAASEYGHGTPGMKCFHAESNPCALTFCLFAHRSNFKNGQAAIAPATAGHLSIDPCDIQDLVQREVQPIRARTRKATGNNSVDWRPRRDLNPCYRRERPVSWAELDDGDAVMSRAGFDPATLCLKV
jgi:hypothetical protein